jgi:DNA replication ATP-dependent helicase Dna2
MRDDVQLAALQEELSGSIRAEHDAQRNALARIWALPVGQRVEEGHCVTGGRVRSVRPPHGVILDFPANDSRFRDGDLVVLSQGNPEKPLAEAVVVRAEDEWIELELWGKTPDGAGMEVGSGDLQIDEGALDLERYFLAAIDDLGKTAVGREVILPLLAGGRKPLLDLATFEGEQAKAVQGGCDDQQAKAVAAALSTDVCWLIHGPPGTGKTRVLAWIVRGLVERGERVLVTGANHRAINNLLGAIARLAGDIRGITKVTPFRDAACPVAQVGHFSEIPREATEGAFVIGATPFALRSRRLSGVDFDTVLIDEASQVSVELAVMAMLAGRRYILAGDHHQLPPVRRVTDPGSDAASASIFGRLVDRGMDTMLTTTHRLNEPLCAWPSATFYQSRLEPSVAAAGRRLAVGHVHGEIAAALAPDPACVWLAVDHVGARTFSAEEVEAVSALLRGLRAGGVPWEDVGVVVPFRRQARILRQRLGRDLGQPLSSFGLIADTVERMQGQEREVVIVTLAASDPGFVLRVAGFLLQPQRINVAATRARSKVIVVASPDLVEQARSLPGELAGPFLALIGQAARVDY